MALILSSAVRLVGRRRNEEPLVDARVNRSRSLRVGLRYLSHSAIVSTNEALAALNASVGEADLARFSLTRDETLPSLVAFVNDFGGVLPVLGLAGESKLVLGLAVGDFVDAEPLVGSTDQAGKVTLDILNVVELGSERVVDIDNDDFPVGLTFVEESHDTEDLDLLDLTSVADLFADLAHIERVVVTLSLGVGVGVVRVLPSLGESAVVPDVTLVREAVANEAQLALLGVLLEAVEALFLGDLDFGVGPAGDLNDHVENRLGLVGEEGDIVEGRSGKTGLGVLEVDTVVEGVGRANGASLVVLSRSHGCGLWGGGDTVGQLTSGLG